MSFMFNPCRYDDPKAINRLEIDDATADSVLYGNHRTAEALAGDMAAVVGRNGRCVAALDGYTAAELETLLTLTLQHLASTSAPVVVLRTAALYKAQAELDRMLADNLPEDRTMDPVLLYGRLYEGGYEGLMDEAALAAAAARIEDFRRRGSGVLILCGHGSLVRRLRGLADLRCWADLTPKRSILAIRDGGYVTVGDPRPRPLKQVLRRCYYVDFECAQALRRELLGEGALDWYLTGDPCEGGASMPYATLKAILRSLASQALRCSPVYLKGVWGGHFITRIRDLPASVENCAWSFEFIPMEASLVAQRGPRRLEFPFYTLLQAEGPSILGEACMRMFGGYFPIRFNYDDTWHASGNMSIQVHPGEEYVVEHNNELGRQDESYYIVEAAEGAQTYLGFRDGADVDAFLADVFRSERERSPVDYASYVDGLPSRPGMQVLIPAGTIHASGRNQLVLEIGSLTVGSYTYKMYDYLRADLDGQPRPIHSRHGAEVLRRERDSSWVAANLVQAPRLLRRGEGFEERIVGEHELLYFSLRTVSFAGTYPDDTAGKFHVLALVNGESVVIEPLTDPRRSYTLSYLDIVLVPASVGPYRVVNLGNQPATIHKTLLKEGFDRGAAR